jgi:nucleotide-binding universal stress UspA family protein
VDRILIALDSSPAAAAALERGLELAAQQHAAVAILHVLPADSVEDGQDNAGGSSLLEDAMTRAEVQGVRSEVELGRGDPAEVILSRSEALDVSLIVLGSRGRSPTVGALLGTVSSGVVKKAGRPVLVVRSPARSAEAG